MNQSELLKGTLSTMILKLLEENGRMYGYEIALAIKTRTDGKVLVKEGSLYPALHKLEADGHLLVEEEFIGKRKRRYYSLTPKGSTQQQVAKGELQEFLSVIQGFFQKSAPTPAL